MESEDRSYIVMAYRYGDGDGYLIGWDSDLEKSKKMADDEWEFRGCMKYSGVVFSLEIVNGKKILVETYRKVL